jgi:hypothetical protein
MLNWEGWAATNFVGWGSAGGVTPPADTGGFRPTGGNIDWWFRKRKKDEDPEPVKPQDVTDAVALATELVVEKSLDEETAALLAEAAVHSEATSLNKALKAEFAKRQIEWQKEYAKTVRELQAKHKVMQQQRRNHQAIKVLQILDRPDPEVVELIKLYVKHLQ